MTDITSLHEIGLSEEGLINAVLPLRDHVVLGPEGMLGFINAVSGSPLTATYAAKFGLSDAYSQNPVLFSQIYARSPIGNGGQR